MTRRSVRDHEKFMRAQGLRPVVFWVPDVTTPEFRAEAHRQSLLIAQSSTECEDQAFIDAISED